MIATGEKVKNSKDKIRMLIGVGAYVNIQDNYGNTAEILHFAAKHNILPHFHMFSGLVGALGVPLEALGEPMETSGPQQFKILQKHRVLYCLATPSAREPCRVDHFESRH